VADGSPELALSAGQLTNTDDLDRANVVGHDPECVTTRPSTGSYVALTQDTSRNRAPESRRDVLQMPRRLTASRGARDVDSESRRAGGELAVS
jgi:hypothetical protein